MTDELIDLIRREAATVAAMRHWTGTVVVTAYNPQKHTIKGILVPHEIETGEIPIGVGAIGNGYGDLIGPKVGSAEALDGDQFNVAFDAGNTNTLVATHRIFSDQDKPPVVQSGEMLRQDSFGNKFFYAQDGSLTIQHHSKQGAVAWDKDGNLTVDSKGQALHVSSSGGPLTVDPGSGSLSLGNSQAPVNIVAQTIALTGSATLNSKTIATEA